MALTKITSRILDSSGVTTVGTISTGVWQGTAINQTYLVGQSGTNTGDETLARINALDITELGTISSGVWNGTAIDQTYLVGQSGTNTGDQTTISGNAGTVTNGVYTVGNQTIGGVKTFSGRANFNGNINVVSANAEIWIGESTGGGGAGFLKWNDAGNYLYLGNSYNSAFNTDLVISSIGNVGIGTTVPQYPLQVKSGTNINFSISTGVADNTAVRLNAVNDAVTANIPMEFYATKFNFNNGNVGIGTTSPSSKLQIHTTTNAGNAEVAAFLVNKSTTTNTEVRLAFAAHTNDIISTGRYSYISAKNTSGSNGQALVFATNAAGASATPKLTISSGGVVKVNTTGSGTQKLQVIGGIQNWYDTNFNRSTKVGYDGIYISGAQHGYLDSPQDWVFWAGGSEKMRIASGGQVAIGTGTNTTKFRVLQSANSEWTAQFINTGTGPYGVSIDTTANSSNAFSFAVYTNSGTGLFVKNDANVGIGITSPTAKLHFSANNYASNAGGKNYSGVAINANGGDIATGRVLFQGHGSNGVDLCGINNEPNRVVLYNYTDSRYLQTWDHTGSISLPYYASSSITSLNVTSGGMLTTASSDISLKKDITNLNYGINEVLKLNPVSFYWIDNDYGTTREIGFVAQEIEKVVPEVVTENNLSKLKAVNYDKITSILTKAIQEQQTIIEDLKSRIETLEG